MLWVKHEKKNQPSLKQMKRMTVIESPEIIRLLDLGVWSERHIGAALQLPDSPRTCEPFKINFSISVPITVSLVKLSILSQN